MSLSLPDSKAKKSATFSIASMFKQYTSILLSSSFWRVAVPFGLSLSGYAVFCSISPVLLITQMQVSAVDYSFMMSFLTFGLIVGQLLTVILSKIIKSKSLVLIGGVLTCISGGLLLIFHDFYRITAWEIIGAMTLFMVGSGILNPTLKSSVMSVFSVLAATAVALALITSNLISGANAFVASHYYSEHLGHYILGLGFFILFIYFLPEKYLHTHDN